MNKLSAQRWASCPRIEAHEVGRPRFAIGNPYYPGRGDFEIYPIWDTYAVAANTAVGRQVLFTVPQQQNHTQGGLNVIKTALITSMTQASQLANPNRMLVRRISAFLDNRMNQVDVVRFLGETLLSFIIGQKTYLQSVLAKFPAGGGAWLQSVVNGAGIVGNGIPQSGEGFKLIGAQHLEPDAAGAMVETYPAVDGISIAQGQNFSVVLDPTLSSILGTVGTGFTTAAAGATPAGIGVICAIYLEGTQLLPVQ